MKQKINNSIGDRIKELRLSKKWSQKKLAEKINTDNRQVCTYENNKTFPSAETLTNLAKAFDVTVDYILMGKLSNTATDELKDKRLLALFKNVQYLDEEDKNTVINLISGLIIKSKVKDMKLPI